MGNLSYSQILTKINKVLSCNSNQVSVGRVYCRMLIDRYCPSIKYNNIECNEEHRILKEYLHTKSMSVEFPGLVW